MDIVILAQKRQNLERILPLELGEDLNTPHQVLRDSSHLQELEALAHGGDALQDCVVDVHRSLDVENQFRSGFLNEKQHPTCDVGPDPHDQALS